MLAVLFVGTEWGARRVHLHGDDARVSISELPLVLGLFLVPPAVLLAGRVVGSAAAFALRRQSPRKLAFNTALVAADAALTLTVFRLLGGGPGQEPRSWLAATGALVLSGALSRAAVLSVVAAEEGSRLDGNDLRAAARSGLRTVPATVIGLVAVCALHPDPYRALLLLAAAAVVVSAERRHGALLERHGQVRLLVGFTARISRPQPVRDVLQTAVGSVREVLRAECAAVVLEGAPGTTPLRLSDGLDALGRALLVHLDEPALDERRPLLAPRGTCDPALRALLERHGLRDAVVAPLSTEAGLRGVLVVADRPERLRSFDAEDAALLEMLAAQTSLALSSSQLVEQLEREAHADTLTGLANRTALTAALDAALHPVPAAGHAGAGTCGLLLLDLDGFKQVNDDLGHAAGDTLLQVVAQRLLAATGDAGTVARLGGDEFVVVLPGADAAGALRLAGRVHAALRQPVALPQATVTPAASVGIAVGPQHGADPSALLRAADAAMYTAKRAGTGTATATPGLLRLDARPGSTSGPDRRLDVRRAAAV